MSENDKMIEIPILTKFFNGKQIGIIRINPDYLPKNPNYCFAVGGIIKGRALNGDITDFELKNVIISLDSV